MAQRDRVALALGQAGHMNEERAVLNSFLRHRGGIVLSLRLVLDRPLQPVAPASRAEMVQRGVARDAEQPCRGRDVARLEAVICLVGVHEDLGGDVLGVGRGADLRADVGVDAPKVVAVDVLEKRPVGSHGRFMVFASTAIEATSRHARM